MAKKKDKTGGVEVYLDLSRYADILSDKLAQRVNVELRIIAKRKVAVDTGNLRNAIRTEGLGNGNYRTLAETPYAAAQEYGRPDLKKYTFTPYMRPAAEEVLQPAILKKCLKEAEAGTLRQARKNK